MLRPREVVSRVRSCISSAEEGLVTEGLWMGMGQIRMMPKASPVWGHREHWQALLDSAGEGIWGLDLEGRCTFANRVAADTLGFPAEEMIGADMHNLVHRHPADRGTGHTECPVHGLFRGSSQIHHLTDTIFRKDGTPLTVEFSSEPITVGGKMSGLAVTFHDLTQSRQQDRALRRLEKLAAIGQLASSIAHDINNPLESITNLLYLIQQADSMPEMQEYARLAQDELARVTQITLQTLRFHRQFSRPIEVDMAELLGTVMALYTGRLLVRDVVVSLKLGRVPKILCLEGEVRQVINNLVRNALDAMPAGGRLLVRLHAQRDWQSGTDGVRLTVADTGEGISASIRPHLYEPFQTTKDLTGTGLGLWVSKGIVERHGGRMAYRTRRDAEFRGTVFTVWLPVEASVNLSREAS